MTSTNAGIMALIHSERAVLAADLAALDDEQWATPSLCVGWAVREVLARYYQGSDRSSRPRGGCRGCVSSPRTAPFATGTGPLVSGTTLALIMAMTGRSAYCDDLTGDGVATLRERGQSSR